MQHTPLFFVPMMIEGHNVVVVGAGFVGCSIAYTFACETVIVDRIAELLPGARRGKAVALPISPISS